MRPNQTPPRVRYEDVVLRTKPTFYVPGQGGSVKELILGKIATVAGSALQQNGPFPGSGSIGFDGTNDRVTVATDTSYHPGDTFSIGGWFNRTGAGDPTNGPALVHAGGANDFVFYFPTGTNLGRIVLHKSGVGNVYATADANFGTPYTRGWTHVVFTKTGATRVAYLNGNVDAGGGTTTNQTIVASATAITLGEDFNGNLDFQGGMAHWCIWNRVLTADEVKQLYLAGRNQT